MITTGLRAWASARKVLRSAGVSFNINDFDSSLDGNTTEIAGMSRKQAKNNEKNHALLRAALAEKIGRAHVCTPVTNAHLVCHILLEKKKNKTNNTNITRITRPTHLL